MPDAIENLPTWRKVVDAEDRISVPASSDDWSENMRVEQSYRDSRSGSLLDPYGGEAPTRDPVTR